MSNKPRDFVFQFDPNKVVGNQSDTQAVSWQNSEKFKRAQKRQRKLMDKRR